MIFPKRRGLETQRNLVEGEYKLLLVYDISDDLSIYSLNKILDHP